MRRHGLFMMFPALILFGSILGLNSHLSAQSHAPKINPDNETWVFCFNGVNVRRLAKFLPNTPRARPIPDRLIIAPGIYHFEGANYDLRQEGLYRFLLPEKLNLQRIVYQHDIDSLLSAISWIHSHGNRDDHKSLNELTKQALHSKLLITCGVISRWGSNLLTGRDIKSRLVASSTLERPNGFDDGHGLIEVWRNKWHKWVLYDVDLSNFFVNRKTGIPMSFVEFAKAVADRDNYEIVRTSLTSPLDVGGFKSPEGYNFAFYMEGTFTNVRTWYERVMQVPMIYDDRQKCLFYYVPAFQTRVKSDSHYRYLPVSEFVKQFYQNQN